MNDLIQKLKDANLKMVHVNYLGHSDKSKGFIITLQRKDLSVVGNVHVDVDKTTDKIYREEYILTPLAARSDIKFGIDYFGEGNDTKSAMTSHIFIEPDLRDKGLGAEIVKYQEDIAREHGAKIYFIKHADNQKFWTKMGYIDFGNRLFYKYL